jgi:hypothetical protein
MLRVQLGCESWFNIELYGADSHFSHSAYVTWSCVELWSAHVPARLSNFCCRTNFLRRDVRVERPSDVTSCFQKWRKCWLKVRHPVFLYDTKPPDYRDHDMRANAWKGIGKELKIKRKLCELTWREGSVSPAKGSITGLDWTSGIALHTVAFGSILLSFKCTPKFRLFNDAVCSADCIAFYTTSSFYVRNPYQNPACVYHLLKVC